MIQIGLTGWGDHPDLLHPNSTAKDKLLDYGGHFPIVELDSTFYAIQPARNIQKWIDQTPKNFQFIVKAYKGMTGHQRGELPFTSIEEMYELFILSLEPLQKVGKLAMILVQFPPWFDCQKENIDEIRYIRKRLARFDIAVEFRHQSWYSSCFREKTLAFLRELNIIHAVCDEPQVGEGSVPLVPVATHGKKALVRLHGRNVNGWRNTSGDEEAWRKVRYLYNYNYEELNEIEEAVNVLSENTQDVFVVFNNNSGKHAAQNAKQFQHKLGIQFANLAPKQLGLFEGEW